MVTVFFANIKLDLLYTTVSNRSREFSQNTHISKELFASYRPVLILKLGQSQSLILRPVIHIIYISVKYQTGAFADHNIEAIKQSYDTRCLHFCRISNWNNCRSLILSSHVALVKLI